MNLFPHSNTNVRGIEIGTLFGQLLASLFGALIFFMREALGGSLDQVACTGQRHMSMGRAIIFSGERLPTWSRWTSRTVYKLEDRLHEFQQRRPTFVLGGPLIALDNRLYLEFRAQTGAQGI